MNRQAQRLIIAQCYCTCFDCIRSQSSNPDVSIESESQVTGLRTVYPCDLEQLLISDSFACQQSRSSRQAQAKAKHDLEDFIIL